MAFSAGDQNVSMSFDWRRNLSRRSAPGVREGLLCEVKSRRPSASVAAATTFHAQAWRRPVRAASTFEARFDTDEAPASFGGREMRRKGTRQSQHRRQCAPNKLEPATRWVRADPRPHRRFSSCYGGFEVRLVIQHIPRGIIAGDLLSRRICPLVGTSVPGCSAHRDRCSGSGTTACRTAPRHEWR